MTQEKNNKNQENSGTGSIEQAEKPEGKNSKDKNGKKKDQRKDDQIKELEAKVSELNDKYLRLYSEFDNYRKRTLKERIELGKNASEEIITALLPVMDDMERAIKASEAVNNKEQHALHEGLLLIYNKLKGILEQKGLEAIKSTGEEFDVDFHDALTNIPAPTEDMNGKVIDEIEKGYRLNGKVIRYAKVVVGN
jgi:molecular chaperone GrpE